MKFSLLLSRFQEDATPQRFLELTPVESLTVFKDSLPELVRHCLFFAFSDKAFLDVLNEEFEVNMERQTLVFRKTLLDAESIRLAGGVCRDFGETEAAQIISLSKWLLEVTRPMYRAELSTARLEDVRREYEENFRIYGYKFPQKLLALFASSREMTRFAHAMTVDAMFKADAAKALFGEESAYYHAWLRKQMFRHMLTQSIEKFMLSHVA